MQAPGGRLLVSPAALRPGDVYLVVRPGRIIEALVTDLWVPRYKPCCPAGERIVEGRRGTFWIEPGYVIVTRRDPAREGWVPERRPSPFPPAPDDAFDFSPWKTRRAFHAAAHGAGSQYSSIGAIYAGTDEVPGGGKDWAIAHSEHRDGYGGWDIPHLPWNGQPHFPWLDRARTACPAEDLGRDDEVRPLMPGESFLPRYMCRLRHLHYGERPDFRELPPEAAARISASLGEEPASVEQPRPGSPDAAALAPSPGSELLRMPG
jgi:hypothetical protein